MKQMKYLTFLSILILIFSACNKEDSQADKDDVIIQQYLADNSIQATKDPSGLYYVITEEGTGDHPDISSEVTVRYKGYLTDGTVFDETTGSSTATFPLSGLIRGWQIGIPKLKQGGKGTFFIPSGLGYGDNATGNIPANSVLIFDIELVSFD
jgi:FKBP-type peptidyl-prolyl cis-trans isomerase FkpA